MTPGLEQLKEIPLPQPVSYLPQTIGWYVLAGLLLVLGALWLRRTYLPWRRNLYRRQALAQLAELENRTQDPDCRAEALSNLAVLVKKVALASGPREVVASLSGIEWMTYLDSRHSEEEFTAGKGRILLDLAYLPSERLERLDQGQVREVFGAVRRWIRGHDAGF